MKANIVLGGLLGLALGAGTVFAVAHGVFPSEPVEETSVETAGDEAQASTDSAGIDAPIDAAPVRHRPLRPGSERIGHLLVAPAQS